MAIEQFIHVTSFKVRTFYRQQKTITLTGFISYWCDLYIMKWSDSVVRSQKCLSIQGKVHFHL
jgi:hypothetical protein